MRFRASYFLAACLPVVAFAAPRYSTERKTGPVPFVILRDASAGVEATIAPTRGGELCGLKVRHAGNWHELLYRACDYSPVEGWRGKAPLLWPATGGTYREGDARGSQRGTYTIDGHKYQMPFHGFVQGMEWNLLRHTAQAEQASVKLSVRDTEETRRFYPFAFRLSVEYVLREGVLELRYAVESQKQNSQKMFFSIGNHITFRTPFSASGDGGAVRMRTPARLMLRKDANNFPNGETQAPPFRDEVMLGDFVANPAVSLGGYSEEPYVELADPAGIAIRMSHTADRLPAQPFVQFNMWGDAKAGYISPEPWVGAQNSLNSRRGLVELAPGEVWHWRISIQPKHNP